MSVIGTTMRDDPTSRLLAAAAAPVRRWPERRAVVLLSAAALFVAIFVLRELVTGAGNAISLLYVIPIALLSLELGMRAGLLAAVAAIAATGVWMATVDTRLGGVALLIAALIFLSVGALAGRFSDRMRTHSVRDGSLLRSGLDLARLDEREALAPLLAEHLERAVQVASVAVELGEAPTFRRGRAGGETLRVPIVSRGEAVGWIEVTAGIGRRFVPEDRLAIEAIALQAAVAGENRRLLELEREQAALRSEVEHMRRRLGDQLRNASQLIERHEQERRGIARRLHDEAAQAMAAALITVGLLERGVGEEMSRAQLEKVRQQVKDCIVDLRGIAASLRPAALDEMGLAMALERFAELEAERGVAFSVDVVPERLAPEVETSTYRVVEGLLEDLEGAGSVAVFVTLAEEAVQIVLEAQAKALVPTVGDGAAPAQAQVQVDLLPTRARVELSGGSLQVTAMPGGGTRVLARIPTVPERG